MIMHPTPESEKKRISAKLKTTLVLLMTAGACGFSKALCFPNSDLKDPDYWTMFLIPGGITLSAVGIWAIGKIRNAKNLNPSQNIVESDLLPVTSTSDSSKPQIISSHPIQSREQARQLKAKLDELNLRISQLDHQINLNSTVKDIRSGLTISQSYPKYFAKKLKERADLANERIEIAKLFGPNNILKL